MQARGGRSAGARAALITTAMPRALGHRRSSWSARPALLLPALPGVALIFWRRVVGRWIGDFQRISVFTVVVMAVLAILGDRHRLRSRGGIRQACRGEQGEHS